MPKKRKIFNSVLFTVEGNKKDVKRLVRYLVQRLSIDDLGVYIRTNRLLGYTQAEFLVYGIYQRVQRHIKLDDDLR